MKLHDHLKIEGNFLSIRDDEKIGFSRKHILQGEIYVLYLENEQCLAQIILCAKITKIYIQKNSFSLEIPTEHVANFMQLLFIVNFYARNNCNWNLSIRNIKSNDERCLR